MHPGLTRGTVKNANEDGGWTRETRVEHLHVDPLEARVQPAARGYETNKNVFVDWLLNVPATC